MKSVSDGNLEIEVPSNEKNEIGELGFEFNRMTKNLHKTYISLKQEIKNKEENEEKLKLLNLELDSKVSERTEKLQKSNAELEHFTSTKEILEKEVKKRTKELEIEKRKIETIIETIPDPIILFNDDYEISFANKSFFLLKNKIDQIFKDKKSINNNKSIVPLITDILKDKDNIEMTIEPVENNYYMAKSKNVIDPENDLRIGTVVELSDITNFVKYDKLQKEFFSSISHELRTPITALKLSLENLAKYGNKLDIQKQERIWNILTSNTNLLADMIEDLLLLSRVQEHRLELKLEDCEINSIIMETVIPQLELSRSNKNIEITTNIQKNLRIIADHKRLSQIFRIFIDNGIKYSENDKKIVISSLINYQGLYNPQNKKGCLIKIIDEGIGIRKEELGNLFNDSIVLMMLMIKLGVQD
jgi:two-component system phosphate regulon sensor histidine kinase PhoR